MREGIHPKSQYGDLETVVTREGGDHEERMKKLTGEWEKRVVIFCVVNTQGELRQMRERTPHNAKLHKVPWHHIRPRRRTFAMKNER